MLTDKDNRSKMDVMDKGDNMSGEWIKNDGCGCPVPDGTLTEVKFSDGDTSSDDSPEHWNWDEGDGLLNIVEYRVVVQPSVQSERDYAETPKEERPHNHYHKDVSHLKSIDVYRVIELWELDSPPLQHALKKILVAGGRGHKGVDKDIQEAIDSLERWKEMKLEDNNG